MLGAGVGLVLHSLTLEQVEQVVRLNFPASNNEAEYETILVGLDLALTLTATKMESEVTPINGRADSTRI